MNEQPTPWQRAGRALRTELVKQFTSNETKDNFSDLLFMFSGVFLMKTNDSYWWIVGGVCVIFAAHYVRSTKKE